MIVGVRNEFSGKRFELLRYMPEVLHARGDHNPPSLHGFAIAELQLKSVALLANGIDQHLLDVWYQTILERQPVIDEGVQTNGDAIVA